jgi:HK97 family phage prohead protease
MNLQINATLHAVNAAGVDGQPRRTVEGVAVEYNVDAVVSDGTLVRFLPGSLPVDGAAPKFIRDHDLSQPLGIVAERVETSEGMLFSARISETRAGDEALTLAADGVLDAVSVGVEPVDYSFDKKSGAMVIKKARWRELSLLAFGAFPGARVASVAAAEPEPETTEPETEGTTVEITNTPAEAAPAVEASIPTQPIFASAKREQRLPSMSEYISAYVAGGDSFMSMNNAIRAAAGDQIVSNVPGNIPTPIVQPVFDGLVALRPIVELFGARSMPRAGATFIRPYIDTHLSVAQQSTQLTAVSATTQVIEDKVVSKLTFAGQQTLAEQVIDWSDASAIDIVVNDFVSQYADATDNYAADQLLAGVTQASAANVDFTDPDAVVAAVYTGAKTIAASSNVFPDAICVSMDVWQQLGSLYDTTGRPLFSTLNPTNAPGTMNAVGTVGNILGLRLVADKNFAAKTCILAVANPRSKAGYEIYEDQRGLISIEQPSTLGRTLAIRGYFATTTIDATKTFKITQA